MSVRAFSEFLASATCNPNLQVTVMLRQVGTIPSQTETTARVHLDTVNRGLSTHRLLFLTFHHWWRNSALRLLLSEGNSLLRRMKWIREIRAVERQCGKDSIRQWRDQSLVPAAYKAAYIDYMRQTGVRHPFLSIFDLLLLSRTWKAGLEYGIHIGTLRTQEKRDCR